MTFKDRTEAGQLLAKKLEKYQGENIVVYALPRGGVVPAYEIAKTLQAPLDLIITRKIGHPYDPEYALAAVSERGHLIADKHGLPGVNEAWLDQEIRSERQEAQRRRELFMQGRKQISPKGKTAILVDDGVATGLTLRAGIEELRDLKPYRIVVAVPVIPDQVANSLKKEVDELIALEIPPTALFRGAVSSYYETFDQVIDQEVMGLLHVYDQWFQRTRTGGMAHHVKGVNL